MAHSRRSTASRTRKALVVFLLLASLFLLGTVVVLSTVSYFLAIPAYALLSKDDVGPVRLPPRWREKEALEREWDSVGGRGVWDGFVDGSQSWHALENVTVNEGERIPRIIHQTWKDEFLPDKWRDVYLTCRSVLPSYTYHLWTDSSSRSFLSTFYPWFLETYDNYPYPIQRADAIRYFVLHRYGGVYMDLDVGCRRELGGLISGDWDVVLAKTIPVGVSNDVMLSSPSHPFMEMTIHSLVTFAHKYVTNYPTVMFSTGPMFLSAQYGIYTSSHPLSATYPRPEIRILPKSLYGKNAKPEESTEAFFSHYYGSSWHADDAGFITWLGRYGRVALWAGIGFVVFCVGRFILSNSRRGSTGKLASTRNGIRKLVVAVAGGATGGGGGGGGIGSSSSRAEDARFELLSFLPGGSSTHGSIASSPTTSSAPSLPSSPTLDATASPLLPLTPSEALLAFRKAASDYLVGTPAGVSYSGSGSRRRKIRKGVLYFLPAIFTPTTTSSSSISSGSSATPLPLSRQPSLSSATILPPTISRRSTLLAQQQQPLNPADLELGLSMPPPPPSDDGAHPPPYESPLTPGMKDKGRVLDHIDEMLKLKAAAAASSSAGGKKKGAEQQQQQQEEVSGWSDWRVEGSDDEEEEEEEEDDSEEGESRSTSSDEGANGGRC